MVLRPSPKEIMDTAWKILIIDDDEEDFLIARDMLKEARGQKFDIHWASSYTAGREELFSNDYNGVLVDYNLGIHSGIELIREANEREYTAPLILFTGRGGLEVDIEAMQAGATLYLTKNEANPLLLERSIRYAIEIKQKETSLRASEAQLRASEANLRMSEARMREFLENTHDTYFSLDREWRFTYANRRFGDLMGVVPNEITGKNFWELFPHYLGTDVEQYYRKVMAEGVPVHFQRGGVYTKNLYELSLYPTREGLAAFAIDRTEDLLHQQQLEAERARLDETVSTLRSTTEALRRSEEKFARAFRSSPVAISITSLADGRLIEVNDSYTALFGYTREEMIGHTTLELGLYPDPQIRQEALRRFMAGEGFRNHEIQVRTKSGDLREVLFSAEPLTIDGQECGLSLVVDITDRKRAEDSLRASEAHLREREATLQESEQRYRTLFENSPEAVFLTMPYGSVLAANPAACAMFGYSEDEIIQLRRSGLLDTEDPRLAEAIEAREQTGRIQALEYTAIRKGGERFPVEVDSVILPGKPSRSFVIMRDITKRKRAEQALMESEKRLRRLMEGNIIGINVRDADGRIQDANPAFLQIIGYSCDDLADGQLTIQNLTSSAYLEIDQQAIEEAKSTGSCKPYEKEYIHKDGHPIPALVAYTRLDENSEHSSEEQSSAEPRSTERYIGYVVDLTERKQAQMELQDYAEKLKQSNRELEQFAFVASHDLQEPVRKIKLFGSSLQQKLAGKLDQDTQDSFQRMISASDRMQVMIQSLLELSRVNTQARPFGPVDLSTTAAEVLSDLEPRILRTGGKVVVETLPLIEADPIQIHQVLQNLIGNALKFHKADTPPQVSVTASLTRSAKGEVAAIRVADNGIGFDVQQLATILQPFGRLHGRSEYEGSGMGLAIVKKIVERHHGQISAQSTPGEGSVFIVTLPVKQIS